MNRYEFEVVNPQYNDMTYYQIPVTTWELVVPLDESIKGLCAFCTTNDPARIRSGDTKVFYANETENGYMSATSGSAEGIGLGLEGTYVKYDRENKLIKLHLPQWRNIRCGTWKMVVW